ncbi:hypothetical protein ACS0TY_008160 [Phlomoides rotata]
MISNQITIPFWGHTWVKKSKQNKGYFFIIFCRSTESRIQEIIFTSRKIVLKNFILTVAGVSAVVLLLSSEMKQSAFLFRRNACHIRN